MSMVYVIHENPVYVIHENPGEVRYSNWKEIAWRLAQAYMLSNRIGKEATKVFHNLGRIASALIKKGH
ncbi:MAG: hypothetical protein ACD_12C00268G0002 [uncultured bacterium]|nr:MAG: hypothetical protein ACD_12C00268G0002 [uncultured bacterium]